MSSDVPILALDPAFTLLAILFVTALTILNLCLTAASGVMASVNRRSSGMAIVMGMAHRMGVTAGNVLLVGFVLWVIIYSLRLDRWWMALESGWLQMTVDRMGLVLVSIGGTMIDNGVIVSQRLMGAIDEGWLELLSAGLSLIVYALLVVWQLRRAEQRLIQAGASPPDHARAARPPAA